MSIKIFGLSALSSLPTCQKTLFKADHAQIIAIFIKDGTRSHHGHSLEYSELKVLSSVSQDPLGV